MRFLLLSVAVFLLGGVVGCARPESKGYTMMTLDVGEYAFVDVAAGEFLTADETMRRMAAADVVFVGENHDHSLGHLLEQHLLEGMFARTPNIAVSFEMFERDVQQHVDAYLAGKINEKEFLSLSRPWPNYPADYRPMLEFARSNSLPVVAANIPRPLAMVVGRGGLEAVPEDSRKWVASELFAPDDDYKKRFIETMQAMGHQPNAMKPAAMSGMLEAIYRAQCIKDDTMAESIVRSARDTGRKVIHYNGCFHSDFGMGTAARVKRLAPEFKVMVIKVVPTEGKLEPPFEAVEKGIADVLIPTTR